MGLNLDVKLFCIYALWRIYLFYFVENEKISLCVQKKLMNLILIDGKQWHLPKFLFAMSSVPDLDPSINKKIYQEEP
jgi:hypothetical protein